MKLLLLTFSSSSDSSTGFFLCVCVCVCLFFCFFWAHVTKSFQEENKNGRWFLDPKHPNFGQCLSSVQSLSHVQLFVTLWTVAHQAPLSMGFSRQEYWNRLPLPSPGDLPDPGIEPKSPTLQQMLYHSFNVGEHSVRSNIYSNYDPVFTSRLLWLGLKMKQVMVILQWYECSLYTP